MPIYKAVPVATAVLPIQMPEKHERSTSDVSNDAALNRRRQLRAERNRQFRARQRALHTASTRSTQAQLQ